MTGRPSHPPAPAPAPAAPAPGGLDFCLRLALAHAVVTRRLDNALSALHGLSFGDFTILHHLGQAPAGKLRRVDLAERLGLTASGVTRTLLPLEKIGLVARESDPRDARVAHATLTRAGRRLLTDATASAEALCRDALQGEAAGAVDLGSAQLARLAGMRLPTP